MLLDLEETKQWLKVDWDYEDAIILRIMNAAEQYLTNSTGKKFDSTNHIAVLFCLVLVTDWYENRELIGTKVSEKRRFSVESMRTQLQTMS